MLRWTGALVAAAAMSAMAALLVTGHYIDEGPVIAALTRSHGVHQGDLVVLAGWVVGMIGVLAAAAAPRRRERQG